jgi:hypothetical protein
MKIPRRPREEDAKKKTELSDNRDTRLSNTVKG